MKKVAGTLKLIYSQYRELQSFAQFGSDLDADTKARLAKGERIVEILKQPQNSPLPVEKQVAIIYAVVNDLLADVPVERIHEFETGLNNELDIDREGKAAMEEIRRTGVLGDEAKSSWSIASTIIRRSSYSNIKGEFVWLEIRKQSN